MTNKMIANCIVGAFVLAVIAAIFETDFIDLANALYSIAGLAWLVFGIWGVVRLYRK